MERPSTTIMHDSSKIFTVTMMEDDSQSAPADGRETCLSSEGDSTHELPRWLVLRAIDGRRFVTVPQPDGAVAWELEGLPRRGRVLSQAVCTDVGRLVRDLHDLPLRLHHVPRDLKGRRDLRDLDYIQAAFRFAAMPETFDAPDGLVDEADPVHLMPGDGTLRSEPRALMPGVVSLLDVLSAEECKKLRERLEMKLRPDRKDFKEYQKRTRCVFSSKSMAAALYSRVLPAVRDWEVVVDADGAYQFLKSGEVVDARPDEFRLDPELEGTWRPVGLHEYLRFAKYDSGGFLRKHCDAMYRQSKNQRSFFTCMFYLNGDFAGGSTRFLTTGKNASIDGSGPFEPALDHEVICRVSPKMGECLIFLQPGLLHEAEALRSQEKYIFRSDVIFRREPQV